MVATFRTNMQSAFHHAVEQRGLVQDTAAPEDVVVAVVAAAAEPSQEKPMVETLAAQAALKEPVTETAPSVIEVRSFDWNEALAATLAANKARHAVEDAQSVKKPTPVIEVRSFDWNEALAATLAANKARHETNDSYILAVA